jgi:ribosome biogenesis protein UTP30
MMGTMAKKDGGSQLSKEQVMKAVTALLKWVDSRKEQQKPQLLDDDDMVHLVISLKKTPDRAKTNPYRISIPHSLHPLDAAQEVCLLVKDVAGEGQKQAKHQIAQEAGTGVSKVIGVSKLKTKYKPYEAKRRLCGSYDLFVADDRILGVLPKLLGKTFFKKKKHPIPVALKGKNWAASIRRACDSTYLYISGGSCSDVRVARISQEAQEIVDNVMAAAEGIAKVLPKKWATIQSLYLKTSESAALPLYNALPNVTTKIAGGSGVVVATGTEAV